VLLEEGGDGLAVGHVQAQGLGLAALGQDVGGHVLGLVGLGDVGEDDGKAVLGQAFGHGGADAARASGDERSEAGRVFHGHSGVEVRKFPIANDPR